MISVLLLECSLRLLPKNSGILTLFNYIPLKYINILIDSKSELNRVTEKVGNDTPEPWQLSFQDSASPSFSGIIDVHNYIMFYLFIIIIFVSFVLVSIIRNYNEKNNKITYKYHNHGTLIELIWTITPALILIGIAFPSFKLLYLLDEVIDPSITVKVLGHQWFWSYEYSDNINENDESLEFDSYIIPESDLEKGQLRLLEVDNRIIVPTDTHIRFIISSTDVIHSFGVPSLGLKVDAIPGRLNQTSVLIERDGVYYGQCSELCGVNHSAIPIVIEAVSLEKYIAWLNEQL